MTRIMLLLIFLALVLAACTPSIRVRGPDEPIEISMVLTVKHEHTLVMVPEEDL